MRFQVLEARRGRLRRKQWYARIVASNGEVLFWSEGYSNKADAIWACGLVQAGAPVADVEIAE